MTTVDIGVEQPGHPPLLQHPEVVPVREDGLAPVIGILIGFTLSTGIWLTGVALYWWARWAT